MNVKLLENFLYCFLQSQTFTYTKITVPLKQFEKAKSCQKYPLTCLDSHMSFSDIIPHQCDVGPPLQLEHLQLF